jgi:hypothetical protein
MTTDIFVEDFARTHAGEDEGFSIHYRVAILEETCRRDRMRKALRGASVS